MKRTTATLSTGRRRGPNILNDGNVRMFDEVGPQFAHKLVQEEGWTYVDGEANRIGLVGVA